MDVREQLFEPFTSLCRLIHLKIILVRAQSILLGVRMIMRGNYYAQHKVGISSGLTDEQSCFSLGTENEFAVSM
jgi:hypothetical protein